MEFFLKIADEKVAMRAACRVARNRLIQDLPTAVLELAFSRPPSPLARLFGPGKTVAGYIAIGSEASSLKLLEAAHAAGCKTALPHVTSKTSPMRFLNWSPGDPLVPGAFGLQQPQETAAETKPDITLVPLIAFDRSLYRLGQGASHYDRALALLDDSTAVGVGWSVQEVAAVPVDVWDIPMDAILTEKEWISHE